MTSPLEKLAAHSGPLSAEPSDRNETAGLLRSGLARLADAHNDALSLEKGSGEPNREKVGRLTEAQLRSIAETKMPDLNARDVEEAMKVIAGTARSMGVETP